MKIHVLKTWPEYFKEVESGNKNFELRLNDRDFQVGDRLDLMEYDPNSNTYSGNHLHKKVTYILPLNKFVEGSELVIMSIDWLED